METISGFSNIGLVLLSSDFKVVGMNDFARNILGPAMQGFDKNVFQYHSRKSQLKIKGILDESQMHQSDISSTMVIDVLSKVLMINVCRVIQEVPSSEPIYVMSFLDVTDQVGAETSPQSGLVELKKLPVISKGSLQFLDIGSIYFIQSDGNYCKIFTETRWFHLHFTLKNILKRYVGNKFFLVHKCFIVNTYHIERIEQDFQGHMKIVFDKSTVPLVPVSRRKMHALKNILSIA
ncbi:MAG: LytTR family DNA-binding domain-containing protein [bacterium]